MDKKLKGIFIYILNKGVYESNEICDNLYSNIFVQGNSDPTIKNNKIYNSQKSGIYKIK
jgi:hypothetical protein